MVKRKKSGTIMEGGDYGTLASIWWPEKFLHDQGPGGPDPFGRRGL